MRYHVSMKKFSKVPREKRIHQLTNEDLQVVIGGGLSGPDQCVPNYYMKCIAEYVPITTQDA